MAYHLEPEDYRNWFREIEDDILRREIRKLEEMIKDGTNGNDSGN